jgi:SAM-dependent methyltransferase
VKAGEADNVYGRFEARFGPEDPRASGYRSLRSFEFEAALIRELLRRHDGWILDVACGHGLITSPLAAEGRCVFGLDYNQTAACSAAHKGLITLRGDAFAMPVKDTCFDVVLSTEFLQQYGPGETNKLIGEMARVTRPGGVVILIWRHGVSLLRRLITTSLQPLDRARGRPSLRLFDHSLDSVRGWAAGHQLALINSLAISPLLYLTLHNAESLGSRVFSTSFVAVFRKVP